MAAKTVGERVRARREELELTQVELAKRAGIGQSALSLIERGGTVRLRAETLLGLSRALRKPPEWIHTGSEAPASVPDAAFRELLARLDDANRWRLLGLGRALLAEQSGRRPSVEDPFPGVPKPPRTPRPTPSKRLP